MTYMQLLIKTPTHALLLFLFALLFMWCSLIIVSHNRVWDWLCWNLMWQFFLPLQCTAGACLHHFHKVQTFEFRCITETSGLHPCLKYFYIPNDNRSMSCNTFLLCYCDYNSQQKTQDSSTSYKWNRAAVTFWKQPSQ